MKYIIKVCFERSVPWFGDMILITRVQEKVRMGFNRLIPIGRLVDSYFVDIAVAKSLTDNLEVIDKTGSYD